MQVSATGRRAPVTAVLAAVAEASGTNEPDLPPLYEAVDPEALDDLLGSGEVTEIRFRYAGYRVTATGDGDVTVSTAE